MPNPKPRGGQHAPDYQVPVVMIAILFIIITISFLIYIHESQINGHRWDGTVITPGRYGRSREIGGFRGFRGGGGGGSWQDYF